PFPKFTNVNSGAALPLTWHQSTSSGTAVTNLSLCASVNNPDGTCTGPPAASAPWVSIGTIQITCSTGVPLAGAVEVSAAGGSTLQNLGGGDYRFSLKTTKGQVGTCEAVLFQFDSGLFVVAANVNIKK